MKKPISELQRQTNMVLDQIPCWFYDELGPYDFPRFQHTITEVKSAALGRIEVVVMEISIGEDAWNSDLISPDQLLMTIWPDVTCTWDPNELANTISTNRIKSLSFEIEPSIDFDTVDINSEEDTYDIWDSLAEFVADKLVDHCMYALEQDEEEMASLIEKQPVNLRSLVREKCKREVEKIKSRAGS